MPRIARGIVPAGKRLLPLIFLIAVGAPLAAKADKGIVDVRMLPRLEGAIEDTSRTQSYSMNYGVPTVVAVMPNGVMLTRPKSTSPVEDL